LQKEIKEKPKRSIKDLRDIVIMAKGGDPEAQQFLKEFLNLEFPQERTNFPAMIYIQKQTYLLMCAEHFGVDEKGEGLGKPFLDMARFDAIVWGGYKGFKATQVVDMLKQGTDMSKMLMSFNPQQAQQDKKRFWQRSKPQGEQIEG
jgi:hypothetical protein